MPSFPSLISKQLQAAALPVAGGWAAHIFVMLPPVHVMYCQNGLWHGQVVFFHEAGDEAGSQSRSSSALRSTASTEGRFRPVTSIQRRGNQGRRPRRGESGIRRYSVATCARACLHACTPGHSTRAHNRVTHLTGADLAAAADEGMAAQGMAA